MAESPEANQSNRRLSETQRREAYERFLSGEKATSVARDLGFSRSAISFLFAKFRKFGKMALSIPPLKRGAKKLQRMTGDDREMLAKILPAKSPQDENLGVHNIPGEWTSKEVRDLLFREIGRRVTLGECLAFIREIGLTPIMRGKKPTFPRSLGNWEKLLSPEFLLWRDQALPATLPEQEKNLAKIHAADKNTHRGSAFKSELNTLAIARKFLIKNPAVTELKAITANLEKIALNHNSAN